MTGFNITNRNRVPAPLTDYEVSFFLLIYQSRSSGTINCIRLLTTGGVLVEVIHSSFEFYHVTAVFVPGRRTYAVNEASRTER